MKILLTKKQAAILALATVLIAMNVALAVVYFTRNVTITGGVKTSGQIQIYESDGATVKNTFAFKDFYAGNQDSDTKSFVVKNLGATTVYVYWELYNPPTGWTVTGNKYQSSPGETPKYYLQINKSGGYWEPRAGSTPAETKIQLTTGQSASFSMDLVYTAYDTALDNLSLTVKFTAESS